MKNLYLIFFILILILCTGFSNSTIDISVSYQPSIEVLEQIFKTYMPIKQGVIYTKVPRGLIISVDENKFFSNGDARIKESSLYILDTIALIVQKLKKPYMVLCKKVPFEQIFPMGFGELMPFKSNVSTNTKGFDNRIDFVIIEYEAKR